MAVGLLWPPVSHRYDSKPCMGAAGLKFKDAQGATCLGSDCFCIRAAYSQAARKQILDYVGVTSIETNEELNLVLVMDGERERERKTRIKGRGEEEGVDTWAFF